MGYKSSPRPVFDRPTHIPYAEVTRHVWGDAGAGLVDDLIYASTDKIHQLVFSLAGGSSFKHSEDYRTVFGADEVLYVLSGTSGDGRGPNCPGRRGDFLPQGHLASRFQSVRQAGTGA